MRILIISLLLVGCLGCGTSPSGTSPARSGQRGTIGVSLLTLENPFFKVIGDHITAEGAKHGYDVVVLDAERDPTKQANQIEDFIVRKAAAIVLSPCESRAVVPVIQKAHAAGIPVFTVDIPCREEGAKIVCQVATDNEQGGREAGKAMIEALGEAGGKVVILHFPQAESCRLRVKGFRAVVEAHNASGKGKIDIIRELNGGGLKQEGMRAAEDALQSVPELRGIFAINDPSALGARAALEKANKTAQVKIIGFDGQPEGKQAIKEGKIYADPIQFPDRMGVEVVKAIVRHSKGEPVEPELLIPAALYRQADALKDPSLK
jgi:ribose transport system substrate-binding protein